LGGRGPRFESGRPDIRCQCGRPRSSLLEATDRLHADRDIDDELWAHLRAIFDERELIELCMLVGHHYEMLAMTLNSLRQKGEQDGCRGAEGQALSDHRRGERHRASVLECFVPPMIEAGRGGHIVNVCPGLVATPLTNTVVIRGVDRQHPVVRAEVEEGLENRAVTPARRREDRRGDRERTATSS
jgi:hypothetical protein